MRPETETFRRKERQAMDMKMQAFLDKVKDMADKTGKVSRHAAGVAGKKANDLALATRINLQIFDLNTERSTVQGNRQAGVRSAPRRRGHQRGNGRKDGAGRCQAGKASCAARQAGGNALGNGVPALRQTVRQG